MAGHSKWANIQHRKGKQDAKRAGVFTKLIRLITVAARAGGGDVNFNPKLRDAVAKAKNANMTNDSIDRAIKKGTGEGSGADMFEVLYEGYGPSGVAVMVECLTDNRNRTVSEVRHAFSKCGGNLGTDGSVAYLFSKQGQLTFTQGADEEKIMNIALEAGADDIVTNDDGSIDVTTLPEQFELVKEAMLKEKLVPEYADVTMVASTSVQLDKENAEKMMKLQEMLEEMDDVQQVYSNAEIDQATLEAMGG